MAYETSEQKLTRQILAYLKELSEKGAPLYWEHRSGQGGFGYKKGLPDLFLVLAGEHLEVELKGEKGKRSAAQDKFAWKCRDVYGIRYCCPHDFGEFLRWIEPILEEKEKEAKRQKG